MRYTTHEVTCDVGIVGDCKYIGIDLYYEKSDSGRVNEYRIQIDPTKRDKNLIYHLSPKEYFLQELADKFVSEEVAERIGRILTNKLESVKTYLAGAALKNRSWGAFSHLEIEYEHEQKTIQVFLCDIQLKFRERKNIDRLV